MGLFDKENKNVETKVEGALDKVVEEVQTESQENVDFLNEFAGDGFQHLLPSDFRIPFLRILQPGSPQVKEGKTEFIPGAKPGDFFNTVTNEVYGNVVPLIPVMMKNSWLEWKPNRGGFVAKHEPESIIVNKVKWNEWTYNGNDIDETKEFYVFMVGRLQEGPMIFPLSSSGIKHAKTWNNLIKAVRLPNNTIAPYYSSVWELKTVEIQDPRNNYFQIGEKSSLIKRVRWISREDLTNTILPIKENLAQIVQGADYKQLESKSNDFDKTRRQEAVNEVQNTVPGSAVVVEY